MTANAAGLISTSRGPWHPRAASPHNSSVPSSPVKQLRGQQPASRAMADTFAPCPSDALISRTFSCAGWLGNKKAKCNNFPQSSAHADPKRLHSMDRAYFDQRAGFPYMGQSIDTTEGSGIPFCLLPNNVGCATRQSWSYHAEQVTFPFGTERARLGSDALELRLGLP